LQKSTASPSSFSVTEDLTNQPIHPIKTLNPYQTKWVIKARVTKKGDIKEWTNAKGSGKLFGVDFLDSDGGEIHASGFREEVDRFYPLLEVNKVYLISKCSVKPSNPKFSTVKNEYELTFNPQTIIQPAKDDNAIPTISFNFRSIADLRTMEKDTTCDVVGILLRVDPSAKFNSKAGKEYTKRTVLLGDDTMTSIELTLWGSEAESFSGNVGDVLAVKGAKVSDYNSKSLGTIIGSMIQVNPENSSASRLLGWYQNGGNFNFIELSVNTRGTYTGGEGGEGRARSNVVQTIADVQEARAQMTSVYIFFSFFTSPFSPFSGASTLP